LCVCVVASLHLPSAKMMMRRFAAIVALFAASSLTSSMGEDVAPAMDKDVGKIEEVDNIMKHLTIAMASEVIDERTFTIRDAAQKGKTLIRLGNVAPIEKGSLTDEEYGEKVEAGKAALAKLVEKSMMLWKAAPDEHQPKAEDRDEDLDGKIIIAEAWTVDGHHIPTKLKNEGHLAASPMYESEFAQDILSAAADEEKRDAYKKLEEALKESEAAKAAERKAQQEAQKAEEEAQDIEPLGVGGWTGLTVPAFLILGALTNFGRPDAKKVNLNRKKGILEKFWVKAKGQ